VTRHQSGALRVSWGDRLVYTRFVRPITPFLAVVCLLTLTPQAYQHVRAGGTGSMWNETPVPGVITITAVVTDRKGQRVTGLKPADFELLVDGKPQAIDTAEVQPQASAKARAIAFLLDEFHTAASDTAAVRDGLLRFVDTRLRSGDLAMVVKPLDPLMGITATTDRDIIRRAIETFEGRKDDFTPRTPFERNYMAQAPAAVQAARAQIVTSALRAIGVTLSQKPDVLPAIVLVSDGFARLRTSRDLPANLQTVVRIANRADAPVYAIAPSVVAGMQGTDSQPDRAFAALRTLATDTGGDVFAGATGLDNGLTRLNRDFDARYILTYRPPHGNDGRFHAIQVGVKRQDAQVRAKTGYIAPVPESVRAAAAAPSAPLRVLRRSPLIQSWSGTSPAGANRINVTVTWEPSVLSSGQVSRASTVVLTASGADGSVLFDGPVGPVADPVSKDVPNQATFEAPAGAVRVDMKILDAKGVVLDTDSRDVTTPAIRPGTPRIYAAAVIRTRSAREFRDLVATANAAPTSVRDFRRTDRLLIRVPALDADGAPATIGAVLLNRSRQPMRDILAIQPGPGDTTQFDLPLAGLAPGEYTLRLTLNGPSGVISEHVTFRVRG
jgi:VWFA-related protein